ncbi:hypothetical protein J6590_003788 [Homalodisca vitripennis]|nr:hypothetical protein J6590_003788 [Homalodisca vitripennis]
MELLTKYYGHIVDHRFTVIEMWKHKASSSVAVVLSGSQAYTQITKNKCRKNSGPKTKPCERPRCSHAPEPIASAAIGFCAGGRGFVWARIKADILSTNDTGPVRSETVNARSSRHDHCDYGTFHSSAQSASVGTVTMLESLEPAHPQFLDERTTILSLISFS